MDVLVRTDLGLPRLASGKVRDLYEIPQSPHLLFVATDRVSCYDVVLENGIPHKGAILTQMSAYWFQVLQSTIPRLQTHFVSLELPPDVQDAAVRRQYTGRSMQVRRLQVLPIESIVRGYISGSAWQSYQKDGTVNGVKLLPGLQESQKLDQPIWTPSTKAPPGGKDENITREQAAEILGPYAAQIEALSLQIYRTASEYAADRGIIIADTKFEFGFQSPSTAATAPDPATSPPVLLDEILTPDSSRFWLAASYAPGRAQESLDKQFLRDWLVETGQKGKEHVVIPDSVVHQTQERYERAFELICGRKWSS